MYSLKATYEVVPKLLKDHIKHNKVFGEDGVAQCDEPYFIGFRRVQC